MLAAMLMLAMVAQAAPPKPSRFPGKDRTTTTKQVTTRLTPMGQAGIARGYERLRAGQFSLAEDRFRLEFEADPTSLPAQRGLALSKAGRRACDSAFPHLEALRAVAHWDVDLAVAEGNCALRSGDTSRAVVAFEEAVLLDPVDADAWFGLASASAEAGEWDGYAKALDGLEGTTWRTPRAATMAASAQAWAFRPSGGDDAWDALAALRDTLRVQPGQARAAVVEAYTIEGELWLDLGDPIAAERAFARGAEKSLRAPRVGALRAEATRRLGYLAEAQRLLVEGRARRGDHLTKDVVLARVAIDDGRLDEARAALAELPLDHVDVCATRWYLHRAESASADVLAADEARWQRAGPAPEARLEHLIPWIAP